MEKRRRGTGSVDWYQGRWRARFPVNGKREVVGYYETEDAAHGVLDALCARMRREGIDTSKRALTLGAFGADWLTQRARTHRDADGDRQRWEAYIAPSFLSSMAITAVRQRHVRALLRELMDTPSKRTGRLRDRSTIVNIKTTLAACFRDAVEHELVSESPVAGVQVPRGAIEQETSTDEEILYLYPEEIDRIRALTLTGAQRSAFEVGLHAALRPGELHGLRWGDVRLDGSKPEIVVRYSRRDATKSGKAGRVPLLSPAIDALRLWRMAYVAALGEPADDAFVWPGDGKGCHARGYDWGWTDSTHGKPGIRTRARVRKAVTFKDALRHSGAVHLLHGTWAPTIVPRALRLEEVSRWLRHADIAITHRHYARFTADALHAIARTGLNRVEGSGMLSHLGDLNPGPTVYEGRFPGNGSASLENGNPVLTLAAQYIAAVRAGDARAIAIGIRLAEAAIVAHGADALAAAEGA